MSTKPPIKCLSTSVNVNPTNIRRHAALTTGRSAGAIRIFDIIYVLTAGGPGTSTTTLTWQTYLTTFDSLDFGLGNAYAYTVSLITLGLALVYFKVLYKRGEFEA